MGLSENDIKQYLIEHGARCFKKTERYVLHISEKCGLLCGNIDINCKGEFIFNKEDITIGYNVLRNSIQIKDSVTQSWHTIKIKTSGLKNRIFYIECNIDDIIKSFRKENADEIFKYIQTLIRRNKKETNHYRYIIESYEKKCNDLFANLLLLEDAAEKVYIPDYMENIKEGDEFETRCGVIVRCDGIFQGSSPWFSPIRNLHLLNGLRTDYTFSTYPNGMLQSADDMEDSCESFETDLDIIKKI